jgi:hypothetical protein
MPRYHAAFRFSGRRYGIFFGAHQIAAIDLTNGKSVGHVPEQGSTMSPE